MPDKIIYRPFDYHTDNTIARTLYDIQLLCGPDTYDPGEGPRMDEPLHYSTSPDPLDQDDREELAARVAAYLEETKKPIRFWSARTSMDETIVLARTTDHPDDDIELEDVQMRFVWRESRVPQATVYPPAGTNRAPSFDAPLSQYDAMNTAIRIAFFRLVELAETYDAGVTEMFDFMASYAGSKDRLGRFPIRRWSNHRNRHPETIRQNRTAAGDALPNEGVRLPYDEQREHGLGQRDDALDAEWDEYDIREREQDQDQNQEE